MKLLCPWDFAGKNTGVVCHFLLQGIFLTQGWNPHLLLTHISHVSWIGRQILYQWATWEACDICIYCEIITRNKLSSITSSNHVFFMIRTSKIYSLSNFQAQDPILLTCVTVLWQTHYIPMAYLSYNRKCVLLLLHLFILSGVISLLLSSSILSTYQPGEFIFQCHIFLPFHTVHGVLKARILK